MTLFGVFFLTKFMYIQILITSLIQASDQIVTKWCSEIVLTNNFLNKLDFPQLFEIYREIIKSTKCSNIPYTSHNSPAIIVLPSRTRLFQLSEEYEYIIIID